MDIIEPNKNFDFSKLSLSYPSSIQNNTYFTRILYKDKPLYIQTPKIITKQGFVKNNKKIYCDLLFDNTNEDFIYWIENLEIKCQNLIYNKSSEWFDSKLELNDIESAFNSCLKLFKSGKYYLLRGNVKINSLNGNPVIKIYDETEKTLSIDDVNADTNIISILEVEGIKFTNKNFQIDLEVKQLMVLNTDIIFENCLIKKSNYYSNNQTETTRISSENVPALSQNYNAKLADDSTAILYDYTIRKNADDNAKEFDVSCEKKSDDEKTDEYDKSFLEALSENIIENIEKNENIENTDESYKKNEDNLENTESKKTKEETNEERKEETRELKEDTTELKEDSLTEFDLSFSLENNLETETIKLKKPNEVYYKMYKEARQKAKEAKKNALIAHLEAKNIKQTFMLEDIDDSSDDSDNEMQFMNNYV
jgi:hypothetical protein